MGERVAKAILELHWPHPALLSTIHKSHVLLNDPDHRYPGSRKTTYTLYVNTTSVVTNTLEDGGYYWEGFILGIQTPASAQQQIQRSLCCPPSPDRRHTGGGPEVLLTAPHPEDTCASPDNAPGNLKATCMNALISKLTVVSVIYLSSINQRLLRPKSPHGPDRTPPAPCLPAQALCHSPFPPAHAQLPQLPNGPLGKQQFFSEIINFSCCPDTADVGLPALLDWSPVTGTDRFFASDCVDGLTQW